MLRYKGIQSSYEKSEKQNEKGKKRNTERKKVLSFGWYTSFRKCALTLMALNLITAGFKTLLLHRLLPETKKWNQGEKK